MAACLFCRSKFNGYGYADVCDLCAADHRAMVADQEAAEEHQTMSAHYALWGSTILAAPASESAYVDTITPTRI